MWHCELYSPGSALTAVEISVPVSQERADSRRQAQNLWVRARVLKDAPRQPHFDQGTELAKLQIPKVRVVEEVDTGDTCRQDVKHRDSEYCSSRRVGGNMSATRRFARQDVDSYTLTYAINAVFVVESPCVARE